MKNKKYLIGIVIAVVIVIVIIYAVIKNKASGTPSSLLGQNSNFNASGAGIFSSNPFQTLLTGTGATWQNLFNSNATSGAYNITLPSYISSNPITSANPNAPTLDLQYLPKGCTIDNYLSGNC